MPRLTTTTAVLAAALALGCSEADSALLQPETNLAQMSAAASMSTTDVLTYADMAAVGTSRITRTNNGVSFQLTTTGLAPGEVHTLWMVVFNTPEGCSDPGCGIDDLGNDDAVADVLYAAGTIVGQSGRASFAGHRRQGDASGSILGEWLGLPTPGLVNAMGAEIHFVVHTHGPLIPALTAEMLHSFNAGCGPEFMPGLPPVPESLGTYGPNTCADVQVAIHMP